MPAPELLPCPFCGGKATLKLSPRPGSNQAWVTCGNWQCYGSPSTTKGTTEQAVAAWNRRAPGWQPIETAPKDGSRILACNANAGTFHVVSWNVAHEEWFTPEDRAYDPTHWQPLPAAPEE